ncbi:MinD/ParA family protein [Naasia sp. SYSU D00948]|uniref:MinD/ParA family ATP-binding protein n=1 Tax=Naasia sp. SYSU D00948 TaxID=2817379 RepID=UPI001FED2BAD|nr:MinD/ParA family protein [Naasia sp. SYSU D00948]
MSVPRTGRKTEPVPNKRKKSPAQVIERAVEADHEEIEEYNGELVEEPGEKLASSLPESLTIAIDLPPAPAPGLPEDEAAVRIDDIAVPATAVPGSRTGEISLGEIRPQAEEPAPRTPYRRTGSAYDALLGSRSLSSIPTGGLPRYSTGELPRVTGEAPRLTGEVPRYTGEVPRYTGEAPRYTGEVPRLTGEAPRVEPVTPPGGTSLTRRQRLDGQRSEVPETSAMLTADRLIEGHRNRTPPTGGWNRFVYAATFRRLNLGDSPAERARKELDARIDKQFEGGTRFVPILTRKGGVGKTTVTTLLGMALATTREDRIIAIDANPDRGTLSERVAKQTRATVRDVVHKAPTITGFTDFSQLVSRDETRLDILASDTDPLLSEAFDENDYNVVADLTARFYSIVLTDCGTGIVHSVMRATLNRADSVVIVSGGSVDEARLASETLTWLEANGYVDLVRNAIVALNTATQGTNLVKLDEIEAHFKSRVRDTVRIPYDPVLAAGSVVSYKDLRQVTKDAARRLAALVVDGLPVRRGA